MATGVTAERIPAHVRGTATPEPTIEVLCERLAAYLAPDEVRQVARAYYYAEQAHDGQLRRSGEPYVTHPLAVSGILADMHMDIQSLMAALLHDVIEDTGIGKEALRAEFGDAVAEIVDGVSKFDQIEFATKAEAQAENFQKMAMAMARDIRVILVKLADRLHNMRTLEVLAPEKRRRIARETLEMYAPIALRLGMNNLRLELEDLGFRAMHPMRSSHIATAVRNQRQNRSRLVEQIRHQIELRLGHEHIPGRVLGREKHLYGIYRKMRGKGKSFSEIMDVFAFRIIVDSVDTCYRVLGVIHSLYKPVPGQFKDYIAIPKANGYQSLHTVLFGMHGVPIEVQIRTEEMEEMANFGIAAHWLYKANGEVSEHTQQRARQWVQSLLDLQSRAGNSMEFIENVKIDLFPDEVYVFTPKGKILELPAGATPVDFAYAVHTDVGNTCVGCRINRRLAPLSQPLQSGQTVEIISAPGAQPNPAWLNFVVTGKARTTIRHFLKQRRQSESVVLGRRLLERALKSLGHGLDEIGEAQIQAVLAQTGQSSFEDLLEDIGLGNRVAYVSARQLLPDAEASVAPAELTPGGAQAPMLIRGTEGLMVSYARCCHPIPGDPVVGHISSGRGMVVHRDTCNNVLEIRGKMEKCVPLRWSKDIQGEFEVDLRVEVENKRGIIAGLATKVNSLDGNVIRISTEEKDPRLSVVMLTIRVKHRLHLANIMRRVRTLKQVLKVTRVKN